MTPSSPTAFTITAEVVEVVSDTEVYVKNFTSEQEPDTSKLFREMMGAPGYPFKITPHIDQAAMFSAVYEKLAQRECIGIFPEGGSHDRAEFLPLKPGFAIMALGAMEKYSGLDVKIVPVGLHYFNRDKFRSRAVIEFGDPISISDAMLEKYKRGGAGKREACSQLMDTTHQRLKSITVTAADYDSLMVIQAARRLYAHSSDSHINIEQSIDLTRKFALGYEKFKEHPSIQQFSEKVQRYNKKLALFGIKDHQVEKISIGGLRAAWIFLERLIGLASICLAVLPGLILHAPIAYIVSEMAEKKAREAKKESKVKIEGKDVIGSWKAMIGLGLLPTFYAVYTVAFAIYLHFVQGFATVSSLFIPCFVFAWYFLPLSGYASMKAYEVGGDIIRSLPPLFVCMFYGKAFSEPLRQLRNELQVMIHVIIEEFGPQLQGTSKEEFEKSRIIKSSTNSNTSGAASLSSFGASEEGGRPRSSSSSSTKPSASSFLFGEGFFDWDFVTDADDDIRSFLNDH